MFDECIGAAIDCYEPDFYEATVRIADTPHKCYECGCAIETGDKYEHVEMAYRELQSTYICHTCLTCVAIRKSMFRSWLHGSMWSDIHETHCNSEFCICPR